MDTLNEDLDHMIRTGYHHRGTPSFYQPQRRDTYGEQGRGLNARAWLNFICAAFFGGIAVGGGTSLFIVNSSDEQKFASAVVGKCFETAVGAKGLAENAVGSDEVSLIFASGLRAAYPISNLSEVPCGSATDNAANEGNK
jgi:hypothetical protein